MKQRFWKFFNRLNKQELIETSNLKIDRQPGWLPLFYDFAGVFMNLKLIIL